MAASDLLAADALQRRFGGLVAVGGVSLAVAPGEMVGLVGPNGAGKTTLFNLLAGSVRPDGGRITLAGEDVTHRGPEARFALGCGRTFQIPRPFAGMSVLDNVLAGARSPRGEWLFANFLTPGAVRREERGLRRRAEELLAFVTLDRLAGEPAAVLSGGQRKLLELARILMGEPRLLLLDEPAAGVAPALVDTIADRIRAINGTGVAVLLIEHNIELVRALCPRTVVMADGRVLADGATDAVLSRADVVEAYLGEAA